MTETKPTILITKVFVDSNILLYLLDTDLRKSRIAKEIIAKKPLINSQVLVEVINVCKRKFGYTKLECLNLWDDLHQTCIIVPIDVNTTKICRPLIEKYNFQLFDAIIVSAALQYNCTILYSEDMHNNLLVNDTLKIVNPFINT